ncbi:MAG TPA: hypothetical protein VND94_20190 [Terriglobia bacterium]|nr:hypothetical protein [Terriglobia bacterium]
MIWQVRLLAWLYIALAGLGLISGVIICTGFARSAEPHADEAFFYASFLFLIAAVLILLPGLIGGIGLLRRQAWARIVILALSVLLIPQVPFGAALGGLGLWVLLSRKGRACFGGPAGDQGVSPSAIQRGGPAGRVGPGLLLTAAALAVIVLILAIAGLRLSR